MKRIAIIGKFDTDNGVSDGQAVKTNILTQEIERACGTENVARISTYCWKKNPFALFAKSILAVWRYENVMFLTDEGGIKVFPWLLRWVNISGKCRIHYYVVGGWLSNYLDRSEKATKSLQKLDAIYVEVPAMLRELEERGFRNGVLVNKFRRMTPVCAEDLELHPSAPYRLCYFSRVMKEKGIEECIAAVKMANERAGFAKYTLDIFGSVNEPYQETFEALSREFPHYIRYGGIVDFQKSAAVLKEYFAMLFPTFYASEGYPNAVVDAFAAGLPVIATRWNYNADIIRDREDGILVDVGSVEQIVAAVEELTNDPDGYKTMRLNCLARCTEYLPENAIAKVIAQLK